MQMSKIVVIVTLLLFCPFFFFSISGAATINKQGLGEVVYKGWRGPSTAAKKNAFEKAKRNAFDKYIATFDKSKMLTYVNIRPEIESNLDLYIIDCEIIDDDIDKKSKTYRVVVEASINTSLIEIEIKKNSAVQQVTSEERSYLSFVFVARQVTARKTYDVKITKVESNDTMEKEKETAKNLGDGGSASSEYNQTTVKKQGGSTVQKSDQFEYEVNSSEDINSAMVKILTEAGYEVVEAVYLEDETDGLVKVQNFIDDFKYGDDISGKTRRNAVKGCRNVGIDFFAIGTMDVGAKGIDPVSGMTRVYVSVNGKVLDLRKRFPKTIASVGPVQYAGLGPDQSVASRNALIIAGENAAESLVSQLRAKGIQ
ncbi:hypothetical protein KAI46_04400 [bacterium]|nr:hypothetical protein [bacterium]